MAINAIPHSAPATAGRTSRVNRSSASTQEQANGAASPASFDDAMSAANAAAKAPHDNIAPSAPASNAGASSKSAKPVKQGDRKSQDSKTPAPSAAVPTQGPAAIQNQTLPGCSQIVPTGCAPDSSAQASDDAAQASGISGPVVDGVPAGSVGLGPADAPQAQAAGTPSSQPGSSAPAPALVNLTAADSAQLAELADALQNGATAPAPGANGPVTDQAATPKTQPAAADPQQSSAAQASSTVSQQSGSQASSHTPSAQANGQPTAQAAADATQLLKNANINPHMMQVASDLKASGTGSTLLPQSSAADGKASQKAADSASQNVQKDQPAQSGPSAVTPAQSAVPGGHAVAADAGHAGDGGANKQNGGNANGAANSGSASVLLSASGQSGSQASFAAALASPSTDSSSAAQAGSTPAAPAPAPATAAALAALGAAYAPAGRVVNAASLLQNGGQAEMRVELHTDTLGALELHTVLQGGKIGASINVQNPDARTLLASELPALHQALSNQNLHVENVSISTNTAGGGQAGAQSNSGWRPGNQNSSSAWQSGNNTDAISTPEPDRYEPEFRPGRLSVRV